MTYIPVAGPWIIVPYSGTYVLENVYTKEYYQESTIARYTFLGDAQTMRDKLNAETQEQPMRQIELTITHQGIPKVCGDPPLAAIIHEGPGIVAVEIGLDRWCNEAVETSSNHGAPGLIVWDADSYDPTFILFPEEFCGWTVFVSKIAKDMLRACLID